MNPNIETRLKGPRTHRLVAGSVLILVGLTVLLARWFGISTYTVLLVGLAMLAWGSLARRTGWIIPGGVLAGIGLGILANEGPWKIAGGDRNGVFLVSFALGWFLIFLLSARFTRTQWWALFPGGIMAVLGGGILAAHRAVRAEDMNLVYAALLILLGLGLLFYRGRVRGDEVGATS